MTEQEEEKRIRGEERSFSLALLWKAWHSFALFEGLLPSFCLPSLLPSACTFRGFCLSASSSSTLNTAVPYAPSIKGPNHQRSRGLVWNWACLFCSVRYIYILYITHCRGIFLPSCLFLCLSLCLLLCIISFHPDGLFGTGGLPGWILGQKIPLNIHNLSCEAAQRWTGFYWEAFRSKFAQLWMWSRTERVCWDCKWLPLYLLPLILFNCRLKRCTIQETLILIKLASALFAPRCGFSWRLHSSFSQTITYPTVRSTVLIF